MINVSAPTLAHQITSPTQFLAIIPTYLKPKKITFMSITGLLLCLEGNYLSYRSCVCSNAKYTTCFHCKWQNLYLKLSGDLMPQDSNIKITKIDFCKWCFIANTRSLTMPDISKSMSLYPLEWYWDFNCQIIPSGSQNMTNSPFSL